VRGNPHATFEAAGAGNVIMAAGLRAIAKALEHPPEPTIGAPALDPTVQKWAGLEPANRSPWRVRSRFDLRLTSVEVRTQ
jgi:hypothetical protein